MSLINASLFIPSAQWTGTLFMYFFVPDGLSDIQTMPWNVTGSYTILGYRNADNSTPLGLQYSISGGILSIKCPSGDTVPKNIYWSQP